MPQQIPPLIRLCAVLDALQLEEQKFQRGEPVDIAEFHRKQNGVLQAAKAARHALECLKAGVRPERLTVTEARGEFDRARMEVVA